MSPLPASGSTPGSFSGSRGVGRPLSALRSAPPELLLFGLFSVLVCAADMWLSFLGPQSLKARTVPFTGWVASMPYMFGLGWVIHLMLTRDRRPAMRWALVAPLIVSIGFAVAQFTSPRGPDFGNPYLVISPWRPVWTVAVPALWVALLLLAPRARTARPLPA